MVDRSFVDLDALGAVLEPRCRTLAADQATIQSATYFHWWPKPNVGMTQ